MGTSRVPCPLDTGRNSFVVTDSEWVDVGARGTMVAQRYVVQGALDLVKSDEVVCRRDRTACHGAIELMPARCRDRAGCG